MLFPDLETFSELDLRKVSLDRYASHPSTRILMCAYAFDKGPVKLWQEGEPFPEDLDCGLDEEIVIPWNCSFERALIAKVWKRRVPRWDDAMVHSLYAGLPAGLKDCNRVPFFKNEAETSKETLLINKFCKPSKTGAIHNRETDPEDWAKFCQYCRNDVADTRLIYQWLTQRFKMPERVYRAWLMDQAINERGMPVDRLLTQRAHVESIRLQAKVLEDLKQLTKLENPNSPKQLLAYLAERGYPYTGLGKELVAKALKDDPEKDEDLTDEDD